MNKLALSVVLLLALLNDAVAGGRGGHNTTFDPNSYGGGWACMRSLASGTCGGATAHYVDAVCDGVTDDVEVYKTFLSYAVAQNPALVKLYVPPGSICINSLSATCWTMSAIRCGASTDVPVSNMIIWGYGATITANYYGGIGVLQDDVHQAYIADVAAGSTSATLVTGGEISRFSIGDWVIVNGLGLQRGGYPPNPQFYEFKLITNIVGSTVTFNSALAYSYSAGWPVADGLPLYGPAEIIKMPNTWNQNLKVMGITVKKPSAAAFQLTFAGRTVSIVDVVSLAATNPAPTMVDNFSASFSWLDSPEIDKIVATSNFYRVAANTITIQSPTTHAFSGVTAITLNGTGKTSLITNSKFSEIRVGPSGYGHGNTVALDGVSVLTARNVSTFTLASLYTFSSGTFAIPLNSPSISSVFPNWVPGQKYYFGDAVGINDAVPTTSFLVTAVRSDATNMYIDTDIVGSLPVPSCGGFACLNYVAYGAAVITQNFTGPANVSQYAAPP